MDPHTDLPHPPQSRSIYQLSTSFTSSRSPACSPSHHFFPTFDSTTALTSFLSPSPTNKLPTLLPHPTSTTFTFPPSTLLPPCPLSPSHSLFDPAPASSSSSAASYPSRPSSPVPADPYITSILSSPSEYSFPNLLSGELSDVLSDVGDIGCVVFSSPSSPSCASPWSNGFEVSGGECDSGSASGSSDSEGRAEGAASDSSTTLSVERESQPTTDDDESFTDTAVSSTSPLPVDSTKRRRKPTAKQQQQQQLTTKSTATTTEKGRKRRLTITAAPQGGDDESVVPEDKRERNKQSASDYRKRRKVYVASLEQQLSELKVALRCEREEGKKLRGENSVLRASMQMMREFVQGGKKKQKVAATTRMEEKEEEVEKEEEDEEDAEVTKRWEAAVSVRIPEEYRPVAPSQQVEEQTEEGATHTHNTRKRRGTHSANPAGSKQHKVGLTLFVLFSCFLLYFPWLADLSSSPLLHTPSAATTDQLMGGDKVVGEQQQHASFFYNTPPDCVAQPELCNRGRTILKVMEDSDVRMVLDEPAQYYSTEVAEAVFGVKVEGQELVVDQLALGMPPLSLPISAHNASAALVWLSEHADDSIDLLMEQTASPGALNSEFDDIGWATATDSGLLQQAL